MVDSHNLHTIAITDGKVRELVEATDRDALSSVKQIAAELSHAVGSVMAGRGT